MKQAMTIMKAIQYQTKSGGRWWGKAHRLDPEKAEAFTIPL